MRARLVLLLTLILVPAAGCEPAGDGGGIERRRTPAPAPDPSAYDKAKNTAGAALLQLTAAGERTFNIYYQVGAGDLTHNVRESPRKNADGIWQVTFQLPVTVEHGDVVRLSGAPIGPADGIAHASVYHLGVDLCANVPGSTTLSGPVGCTVTIP